MKPKSKNLSLPLASRKLAERCALLETLAPLCDDEHPELVQKLHLKLQNLGREVSEAIAAFSAGAEGLDIDQFINGEEVKPSSLKLRAK